jgi:hypothetical protein
MEAGKPRHGPVFDAKQRARVQYRAALRAKRVDECSFFTNDLMDALSKKDTVTFWKSWRSKVSGDKKSTVVNGKSDPGAILTDFERFFADQCTGGLVEPDCTFSCADRGYLGSPCDPISLITVEDVSLALETLKRGKAAGLDDITVEHLSYSHPIIVIVLSKLFNLLMATSYVPPCFRESYLVPLVKGDASGRALSCSDFRGICINTTTSKLFEKVTLRIFDEFFPTEANQFGFKSGVGCSHAIFSARTIINSIVDGGSTACVCALDVAKAFPSIRHSVLFEKLINLNLPSCFVDLIIFWYSRSKSCVKWCGAHSCFFPVLSGVMQGSCLAPILFAIYINSIIVNCNRSGCGFILVYADDIMLVARSVVSLQTLVDIVAAGLCKVALTLNVTKSYCLRVGQRFEVNCASIQVNDKSIPWVTSIKYLGVHIVAAKTFLCSFDVAKRQFNRGVNAIVSRVGSSCDLLILSHLISSKCVPSLIYGAEAVGVNKATQRSLDFTFRRFFFKILRTTTLTVVEDTLNFLGVRIPSKLIADRTAKFNVKFRNTSNEFCKLICVIADYTVRGAVAFDSVCWSMYR